MSTDHKSLKEWLATNYVHEKMIPLQTNLLHKECIKIFLAGFETAREMAANILADEIDKDPNSEEFEMVGEDLDRLYREISKLGER